MVLRKMGNTVSPTVELVKEGDEYTFNTVSTFKSSSIKFKLDTEFDEETLDGRKVKSVITLDGNKLVQEQKGDKAHKIIREFSPTELVAVSHFTFDKYIIITLIKHTFYLVLPLTDHDIEQRDLHSCLQGCCISADPK